MNITLYPSVISGTVRAVSSKSAAHRLLFCSAFADKVTKIHCPNINDDIKATVSCLSALGAVIERHGGTYIVSPIGSIPKKAALDCAESGTTYRFLIPLLASLGIESELTGHGRLPNRPLSPLYEVLTEAGVKLSPQGSNPLTISGTLPISDYSFAGNVSSQFASGMLIALAVSAKENSTVKLTLTGKVESLPYLNMTTDILSLFGADVKTEQKADGSVEFTLKGNGALRSPEEVTVEGDYSSAAFWLCAGAVGSAPVSVTGLDPSSSQGDRRIIELLRNFGAQITESENCITVYPSALHGINIDASQIPDLVPILSVVAAKASGKTRILNASRLRLKESDRLHTVTEMIQALGGCIEEGEDHLLIEGSGKLNGGTVDSANDHRIAMSASVSSLFCSEPVTVIGAECTAKSYPKFFEDAEKLGMKSEVYNR